MPTQPSKKLSSSRQPSTSKVESFPCQIQGCTHISRSSRGLSTHRNKQHHIVLQRKRSIPISCPICGKEYNRIDALNTNHLRKYHLEIDNGPVYRCKEVLQGTNLKCPYVTLREPKFVEHLAKEHNKRATDQISLSDYDELDPSTWVSIQRVLSHFRAYTQNKKHRDMRTMCGFFQNGNVCRAFQYMSIPIFCSKQVKSLSDVLAFKQCTDLFVCGHLNEANTFYNLIHFLTDHKIPFIIPVQINRLLTHRLREAFQAHLSRYTIIVPYKRLRRGLGMMPMVFLCWKVSSQSLIINTEDAPNLQLTFDYPDDLIQIGVETKDCINQMQISYQQQQDIPLMQIQQRRQQTIQSIPSTGPQSSRSALQSAASDEFYSTKQIWALVDDIINKYYDLHISKQGRKPKVLQAFYGTGELFNILRENPKLQVHGNSGLQWSPLHQGTTTDFDNTYKNVDIIITNPPFSIKEKIVKDLVKRGKPFILLLPDKFLVSETFKKCFNNDPELLNKLTIIFPYAQLVFKGFGDNKMTVPCVFVCWNIGLFPRSTSIFLTDHSA